MSERRPALYASTADPTFLDRLRSHPLPRLTLRATRGGFELEMDGEVVHFVDTVNRPWKLAEATGHVSRLRASQTPQLAPLQRNPFNDSIQESSDGETD